MKTQNNYSVNKVKVFDYEIMFFDFGDIETSNSLYIQGQLHSNEVNAFSTLCSLVEKFKNIPPPIPVRIVPSCNPIGWETYLKGKDGRVSYPKQLNWNRLFNTIPIKNGSVESELASVLWGLSHGFNHVIDVHTPDFGFPHVYTSDISCRLLTFDDIPYVIEDKTTEGSFQSLNTLERKIPAFTLEVPSCEVWTIFHQEYWAERIFKEVFAYEKKTRKIIQGKPKYFGNIINLYSKISGVPILLVEPNKVLKKNSEIISIMSPDGKSETISFENECIPLCFRRRGLIQAGNMVARVLSLIKS